MGKTINTWLRQHVTFANLCSSSSLLGVLLGFMQCYDFNKGSFVALVESQEVEPPISRNIIVFMENDSSDLLDIGFFPQIFNPSKYALKDVLLTYNIESKDANVTYTDFYSVHQTGKGKQLTNIDKTLYSKSDMPDPFIHFIMHDNDYASINMKATYRGVDEPFSFEAKIYAKKKELQGYRLFISDEHFFNDAYNYAINDLNLSDKDKIFIYLQSRHSFISFEEMIVENLKGKVLTKKPQAQRGAQYSEPIVKRENEIDLPNIDTKSNIENNTRIAKEKIQEETLDIDATPWYIYVIEVILAILLCLCLIYLFIMIIRYFKMNPKKQTS